MERGGIPRSTLLFPFLRGLYGGDLALSIDRVAWLLLGTSELPRLLAYAQALRRPPLPPPPSIRRRGAYCSIRRISPERIGRNVVGSLSEKTRTKTKTKVSLPCILSRRATRGVRDNGRDFREAGEAKGTLGVHGLAITSAQGVQARSRSVIAPPTAGGVAPRFNRRRPGGRGGGAAEMCPAPFLVYSQPRLPASLTSLVDEPRVTHARHPRRVDRSAGGYCYL